MKARAFALVLLLFLVGAGHARADEPPAIVPPRVLVEPTPSYPDGAAGAARVVLEVVVATDGIPGTITVVDGDEPFAAAAIASVQGYVFEPARRGDLDIAAKIRVVVAFTPPTIEAPVDLAPTAVAPPPVAAPVTEVTIVGQRPVATPNEQRIGRADVRILPGAFGDPYRAIEMLPGVVPTVSGLPYYYIRGAPPSAVGYYVDEIRVPYLFHFALGPGVIQPILVDEVSLFPDAFPGRYGRYAGAVVAGKTRPAATELEGEGILRIFDAGAYVETPFADGKGSAGIGGRYSYTAGIFSLVAKDTTIDYRDYNARVSYKLGDRWRAQAFAFGSFDYASQIDSETKLEEVLFASEFHRLDLRADRIGADGATTRVGVTFGVDRTRIEGARFAEDFIVSLRAHHRAPVTPAIDAEVGVDATIDHYTGDLPSVYAVTAEEYRTAAALFSGRTDTASGAWLSGTWHPFKGFDFTATMRGDVFTSAGVVRFGPSPRVSMKLPLHGDRLSFLGAVSIGAQPPTFSIPVPAVGYRGLPGGLGYGYQKSIGLEALLPWKTTARAVGFHHSYYSLRDFARGRYDFIGDITDPVAPPRSPTQALGLELSLRRQLSERVGGFVSYTLSRAQIGSTSSTVERISPFDRTHVFQAGASVDLGRGYRIGARFLTYRGWPDEGSNPSSLTPPTAHLPTFVRVDARFEKRWDFRKSGYVSFIVEVLNATGAKEIIGRDCSAQGTCRDNDIGPITVPSIGVQGAL